jgi:predicted GNAT superfamily acetyltransferase
VEAVPINVLSILEDTGGAVIVAYDPQAGFTSEGWLGFAIGMGTRSGVLYSHMLGVRDEARGMNDLGWYLKVLQASLAVEAGHHAMTWTYDPLRGANARLNIEKLGARMVNFTIDKYGVMRSSLYGDVPTDRFTAHWDLMSESVHKRLDNVRSGAYQPLRPSQISHLPMATAENVDRIFDDLPDQVCYQIPGDIDLLMRDAPEQAIHLRQEMRLVLGRLMTRRSAAIDDHVAIDGPVAASAAIQPGRYDVTGFATERNDETAERASYYVLTRRSGS